MTDNLPAITAKLPPMTPIDRSSLGPSDLERHRAEILLSVETVLEGYWRNDMPKGLRAAVLADWCDELEEWPINSIRGALRKHRNEHPNKKPNPGHILALLKDAWGKHNAPIVREAMRIAQQPAPPKERVSEERRDEILKQSGLAIAAFPSNRTNQK